MQFVMVSSCLPSTTVWAHPALTGLCLLAKTPPPPLLGLSFTKLLPQGISLPCCPSTTHSSLGSTVPRAPASPSCERPVLWSEQPDVGPSTETGEEGSSGRREGAGSHILRESGVQGKGQLARPSLVCHPCRLTCPGLQGP